MQASSNCSQEQQEEEVDPLHQSEASTDSWLDASVPAASGAAMAEGGGGGGGGRAQGQPHSERCVCVCDSISLLLWG